YDSPFVAGAFLEAGHFGEMFLGGTPHSFGGTVKQKVTWPGGTSFTFILQWDSPFFSVSGAPGTASDLDVYLLDPSGTEALVAVTTDNLASGDPVEIMTVTCSEEFTHCDGFFVIVNHAGPNPGRLKYV